MNIHSFMHKNAKILKNIKKSIDITYIGMYNYAIK